MIAYGPVPSRRLGRSLGINHIPPKTCTYSCVYCQLGRTTQMRCERRKTYPLEEVVQAVEERVERAHERGEVIDYLTFVPDGEPTMDLNLGREMELLRPLGITIAVISNGSLLWREDVRRELTGADWVSLKVDAVTDEVWRKVDRPHGRLRLEAILDGMRAFREVFRGELTTETMLVKGVNDGDDEIPRIADFLEELGPDKAYLAVPTRPPAEDWVEPPDEETLNRAYQSFANRLSDVEYLIGYEGDAFAFTGNFEEDLLSITSVHPMREDAVETLLKRAKAGWSSVDHLIKEGKVIQLDYLGRKYYMRRIRSRAGSRP
jgi:wyosine [tRNA(Phe)-imidazoG37] synthetase (radical SAM superfamily)